MTLLRHPGDALRRHLPRGAEVYVNELLAARDVVVRVSRPRLTKLGDHRPPQRGHFVHRISVNEDLNPFAFLTTLLHEIAHVDVWVKHRSRRRPRPHGPEWKREFAAILEPVVSARWLPADVSEALRAALGNPPAMSCSDRGLAIALSRYDEPAAARVRVEDIPLGGVFRVGNGRTFCRGLRVRTRFRCVEQTTGAEYRVHALALAEPVCPPPSTDGRPAGTGRPRGSAAAEPCFRRRAAADRAASRSACF